MSELPPGWTFATGDDVFEFVTSGSRGWAQYYSDEGATFVRIGNLDHGTIALDLREIQRVRPPEGAEGERTRLRPNDVLVSITAELGMIGLVAETLGEAYINQHIALARPRHPTEPRFLAWYLASEVDGKRQLQELRRGATKAGLGLDDIRSIEFPLAPLREQQRIADKLDALLARVDACRERLDRVPGILKRFRQSVLAAATSGELTREWREERGVDGDVQSFQLEDTEAIRGFSFPASWSARRLADIATITGGVTKDSKKQSAEFVELPYLRVANVQRGYLDLSEVKTIRVPPDRVADLLLRAGDVLFNEGGDIDKLGRGWIWSGELSACVFQNHVFRARLLDPAFEPRYFSWYGNSRGYEYFLARGKQTTNLASINKSVLSALPVAVPPADEQVEIVRRTHELLQFADGLERSGTSAAARVVALTPSALAKAFRGELVTQDPTDEPAAELLARLRAEASVPGSGSPAPKSPKAKARRELVIVKKLIDVLAGARGWMTAQEAFHGCGIGDGSDTQLVEEVYAELRELERSGRVAVEPVRDRRGRKTHDRLKLVSRS